MTPDNRQLTVIGGGGGAAQVLLGARGVYARRGAILAVTDSGRSTGVARQLFEIAAPGDLRNTLAQLAADPTTPFARLVQHRISSPLLPPLTGMALGNLMLGALVEITGDLAQATAVLAELLDVPETVVPASCANSVLCAELVDGSQRRGELAVRGTGKPAIRRVWQEPRAPLTEQAAALIAESDLIVIGPGSFYTSLLAVLATEGMLDALRTTHAALVFVCNTTTQPGQTDGMGVADHLQALVDHVGPGLIDFVLLHDAATLQSGQLERCRAIGLEPLLVTPADLAVCRALGITPLVQSIAEDAAAGRQLWNKLDTIRHDPQRLVAALTSLPPHEAAQP